MYVAISEVGVPPEGAEELERAFAGRLHLVDAAPGFLGLEVMRDRRRDDRYLMVTRWETRADYLRYMRSPEHAASHARVRRGPGAPWAAGFREYEVLADPPAARSAPEPTPGS